MGRNLVSQQDGASASCPRKRVLIENPTHRRARWARAVAENVTRLGYWEWVRQMIGPVEVSGDINDQGQPF